MLGPELYDKRLLGATRSPCYSLKNLTIYGTSTTQQIKVHGNADFYGTIYAPTADITVIGTSDLYGAVMGDVLNITSRVHYDECLTQPGRAGSGIVLRVVSWRIG